MYIFIFLHQTTTLLQSTLDLNSCISLYSYIKPQLLLIVLIIVLSCISLYSYIKPQLQHVISLYSCCCISLYSYIKPQHQKSTRRNTYVVYLYIPTSNHNCETAWDYFSTVVYLYIPTSNHNSTDTPVLNVCVVYLYIPTSNHNYDEFDINCTELYIFIFLHQTTTRCSVTTTYLGCISLYSYIKPQLSLIIRL